MRDYDNRSRHLGDTVLMCCKFSERLILSEENSYFKPRVERVNLILCLHGMDTV